MKATSEVRMLSPSGDVSKDASQGREGGHVRPVVLEERWCRWGGGGSTFVLVDPDLVSHPKRDEMDIQ